MNRRGSFLIMTRDRANSATIPVAVSAQQSAIVNLD